MGRSPPGSKNGVGWLIATQIASLRDGFDGTNSLDEP